MTVPTKIKSGAKITVAGEYEADIRKVDSVTIANKVQLTGDTTIGLSYVDKVTGSKFNDTVQLHNAPVGTGTIDLGAGTTDTLKLDASETTYKLTLKNTETVTGSEGHEALQLSSVAAFSTDGSIDTILGDKSGQTVTYTAINANSTVDLGAGSDKIVLANSIGDYTLALVDNDIVVTNTDNHFTLTLKNDAAANKTLKIVINGQTYTWAQAIAYASDVSADADNNFEVTVGAAFSTVNASERSAVTTTLTGIDSDARTVVVSFTDGTHTVNTSAVKQLNGSWTVPASNLTPLTIDGNITVSAVVTDNKGNQSLALHPRTIVLDTDADVGDNLAVTLAEGANISQTAKDNSGETPIHFAVTGLDGDVNSIVVRISDGTHFVNATHDGESGHYLADLTSLNNAPLSVTITVGDVNGNFASGEGNVYNVVNDSFNGTVTEFQAVGSFEGYVSVIVTDTANAFNGSDLSGGQWGSVNSINVTDEAVVTFSAAELAGLTHLVLGNGDFQISGTGAQVAALPVSILNSLGNGDTLSVTDTLTVEQAGVVVDLVSPDATVTYAIADNAGTLAAAAPDLLTTATGITVTGTASTAQLTTIIDHAGDVEVAYSSILDFTANLFPEGVISDLIHAGVSVEVTDGEGVGYVNLGQFNGIHTANNGASITCGLVDTTNSLFGIDDSLEAGAATAIAAANYIVINGALNLAQAAAVKNANDGSFGDVTFDLNESAGNLFSGPLTFATNAAAAIGAAGQVTVTGDVNFASAVLLFDANGNTYNGLSFTAADAETNLFTADGVATLNDDVAAMLDAAGAITVTGNGLTVAQVGVLTAHADTVTYAVNDSATNLLGAGPGVLAAASSVAVNTSATIAQLNTIFSDADGTAVTYSSIHDVIGNLVSMGGVATAKIISGTNVTVDGAAISLAQLSSIDAANGGGTISYSLTDSKANLFNVDALNLGVSGAIQGATSVTISGELNVAQALAVKAAHSASYSGVTFDLTDSSGNLFASAFGFASGASDAISAAGTVTVTDGLTFSRALLVNGANNNSYANLNFDIVDSELNLFNGDGVATLRSDALAMLNAAGNITVSGNGLTVEQAHVLYQANGNSVAGISLTIVDTAANIVASGYTELFSKLDAGAITVNVAPTNVDGLTVPQLGILADRIDNAVTYSLTLAKADIFVDDTAAFETGYDAAIAGATAVTVTDDLTPAQATAIFGQNDAAVYDISSNAADAINVANTDGVNGARDIDITGLVSAADSTTLAAIGNSGTTTYHVSDIASAVIANAAGSNAAASIIVTTLVNAADAASIAAFTATTKTYSVEDTAGNIAAGGVSAGINGATNVTVTGTANVSQATTIYDRTNSGTTTYSISDSAANIFTGSAFSSDAATKAATVVTVTGSVSVDQAATLKAVIDGPYTVTDTSYSIIDTKANLLAGDLALFTSDAHRTVGDADIDITAIGSVTTAQLNALYDRIGHDQVLTYTLSYTVADLFTTPTGTTYQIGIAADIQAASAIVVGEALTAAQAQTVYTTNQDGTPASLIMDVVDSSANILNGGNANGVNAAHNITVTGATPATDVAAIEALTNTGTQHYATVEGAAAAVKTALGASGVLQLSVEAVHITGVTATTDVTIIEGYANTGATSYDNVGGTAVAITGLLAGHADLQAAISDLSVTGTTSTANFIAIEGYVVTGTPTFALVSGTVINVVDILNNFDYSDISNLSVTDTASAQDVSYIEDYGVTTAYAAVQDTTDAIGTLLAGQGGLQGRIVDVSVTDQSTIAEASTIHGFGNTGTTAFVEVTGIAGDVQAALNGQAGFQGEITDITVTGTATTADVTAIEGYVNGGNQTYDTVTGSSANVLTVVGGGGVGLQQDITTLHVTGTTTFADATTIEGYDANVGTVTMDLVTASLAEFLDVDNAGIFADATEIHLTGYNLGAVTVAQVEALLASAKLKDGASGALTISDLTYTLTDDIGNLAAGTGNTSAIVTAATSVLANDDATVAQAKVLYDRNAASTFDITDSASWLATSSGVGAGASYDTVIKAAVDIHSSNNATAAQATAILARDGAGGDVFYNVSDYYANLAGNGAATSYAGSIYASMPGTGSAGADNATALVALAEAVDANGTAKLFMGDLSYDTVSDWSTFVGAHPVVGGTLEYTYQVNDSASNVTTAAGNGDLGILTGSTHVNVNTTMLVSQAETLWNAVVAPFGGTVAAAGKTTYSITDTVANLSNAKVNVVGNADVGDAAGVSNADSIYVSDTAANIHAVQNSNGTISSADADVFQRMNELGSGGITATGSALNQVIAGTNHVDSIDGGADQDTLYGNDGNDTLYGGTGSDTLYGGEGRDTIYAGSAAGVGTGSYGLNQLQDIVIGGNDGDNMFGSGVAGSYDRDQFQYVGATKAALIAESGTFTTNRDYISNLGLGDSIDFTSVADANVQFFGSGSANAQAVIAGTLAISIRYEKNQQVMDWADSTLVTATKVMVDIANSAGVFDDVADMTIIVVGSNIDLNWNGSALAFGG